MGFREGVSFAANMSHQEFGLISCYFHQTHSPGKHIFSLAAGVGSVLTGSARAPPLLTVTWIFNFD